MALTVVALRKRLVALREQRRQMWGAAEAFLVKGDAHGVMDMLAEVQFLDRAIQELEALAE